MDFGNKKAQTSGRRLKLRNRLVEENIHLVKYVVNRMSVGLAPGVSKEDLISIGCWGLIDAADKFNEDKGVLFKTYAITRIRGAILDELRRHTLGGQALCRKAKNLEKAVKAVEIRKNGQGATDEEVARELNISDEKLRKIYSDVAQSFLVSLDEATYNDEESRDTFIDTLQDKNAPDPSDLMEKTELKEVIMSSIAEIPRQEKEVLTMYYYEELTFKEIGMILEVSESRISQIHTKAIIRMRSRLRQRVEG